MVPPAPVGARAETAVTNSEERGGASTSLNAARLPALESGIPEGMAPAQPEEEMPPAPDATSVAAIAAPLLVAETRSRRPLQERRVPEIAARVAGARLKEAGAGLDEPRPLPLLTGGGAARRRAPFSRQEETPFGVRDARFLRRGCHGGEMRGRKAFVLVPWLGRKEYGYWKICKGRSGRSKQNPSLPPFSSGNSVLCCNYAVIHAETICRGTQPHSALP